MQSPHTPPNLPLTTDLPCLRCNYNLRTRSPADLCPECALPVATSLLSFRQGSHWPHKKTAILGFSLTSLGYLLLLFQMAARYFVRINPPLIHLSEAFFDITCPLLLLFALFLLLRGFHNPSVGSPLLRTLLAIAATLNTALLLLWGLYAMNLDNGWSWFLLPDPWLSPVTIALALSSLLNDFLTTRWLVQIATRLRSPRLRIFTLIAFSLFLLLDAASLIESLITSYFAPFSDNLELAFYIAVSLSYGLALPLMLLFAHTLHTLTKTKTKTK